MGIGERYRGYLRFGVNFEVGRERGDLVGIVFF